MQEKDKLERIERTLFVLLDRISKFQTESKWLDKSQLGAYLNVHEDTAEKMAYRAGLEPYRKNFIKQHSWVWKRSDIDAKLVVTAEKWRDGNLKDFKITK